MTARHAIEFAEFLIPSLLGAFVTWAVGGLLARRSGSAIGRVRQVCAAGWWTVLAIVATVLARAVGLIDPNPGAMILLLVLLPIAFEIGSLIALTVAHFAGRNLPEGSRPFPPGKMRAIAAACVAFGIGLGSVVGIKEPPPVGDSETRTTVQEEKGPANDRSPVPRGF